jgi:hypothetical protein
MYQIYLTNFGYFKDQLYVTVEAALDACKVICLECTVYDEKKKLVATFSPICGNRRFY